MAIFNSYVKLPEGIEHILNAGLNVHAHGPVQSN